MSLLEIAGLQAGYGRASVLHGVDVAVEAGRVVCLIGRNGMGKTTTMRSIMQEMVRISAGEIRFEGTSLVGLHSYEVVRRGIGYVPEDRRVFADLTVAENLRVPRVSLQDSLSRWTVERVYELFPQLGEYRHRAAGVLSGGEQQMLSIARSLLTNPRLLLLDEPHEGLAPKVVEEIIAAILRLKAEGVAMLISEQSVRTIQQCADWVNVIDRGMTVYSASAAEFNANPEITRKYLMVTKS